jgi:hypothetical protein
MSLSIYDKGTHYVTNQRLRLEILKDISDCEDVLEIAGDHIPKKEQLNDDCNNGNQIL